MTFFARSTNVPGFGYVVPDRHGRRLLREEYRHARIDGMSRHRARYGVVNVLYVAGYLSDSRCVVAP